jgi:hypothetical protein
VIASLSPAARRALALGILAALLLAAAAAVALPVVLIRDGRAELASVERRIAQLTARLPARERLLDEERVLAEDQPDRILLRGSTPAVAAAQLQGDLTALASAMGAAVASVQILEPEPAPPYVDVGLRLSMRADVSTLRDFLYAVETREPLMVVRAFSLSGGGPDAGGDPPPPGTEPLTATLEVHGYLAAPAPAASSPSPAPAGAGG